MGSSLLPPPLPRWLPGDGYPHGTMAALFQQSLDFAAAMTVVSQHSLIAAASCCLFPFW